MAFRAGFIGVGHMGGGMARRLLSQKVALTAFDTSPDAMKRIGDHGATLAKSAREVADREEFVFVCLPSHAACRAAAFGPNGLAGGKAMRVYIESSTIGSPAVREMAAELSKTGVETIDAPVSGGPRGADAGTLSTMVSGRADLIEKLMPIFNSLATKVFVMGDKPGLAQDAKLVNNALSMSAMAMSSEAIIAGVKAGLDPALLVDMINASSGRNSTTINRFPKDILPGTFNHGGHLSNGMKDISLYVEMCRSIGMPSPMGAGIASIWQMAISRMGAEPDSSNIVRLFEEWAGVEARAPGAAGKS